MDYEQYEATVRRLAESMRLGEEPPELFIDSLRASEEAAACVSFRLDLATPADFEYVAGYLEMNFFGWADNDRRGGWWLFYFDITSASENISLENDCQPYSSGQPLFVGAPYLFGSIRKRENGSPDYELIDGNAVACITGSEVYRVGSGYAKLLGQLPPRIPAFARANFPGAPLYLRLDPDQYYTEEPLALLTEAAIVPTNPKWMKTLSLYPKQDTFAEYELSDANPRDNPAEFREYRIDKLRRLEVSAQRRKADYLSMIIEELPQHDDPNGLMVGRCIHLDTRAPVGTPMAEARLQHLDLAINVYRGPDRAARMTNTLRNGKSQDATYRTHLLRIEDIPFPALFDFANMFLRSRILLREWVEALRIEIAPD